MNNNLIEIIYVLDKSGSMGGIEEATINAFNGFIDTMKKEPEEITLSLVLFNHEYNMLWNGIDIQKAKLTKDHYHTNGTTALYDAVGRTIDDIGLRLKGTDEDVKPRKIFFVISTDGQENASKDYTQAKIKQMIEHQQSKYHWEFIFTAANIDTVAEANKIGISAEFTISFQATNKGIDNHARIEVPQFLSRRKSI